MLKIDWRHYHILLLIQQTGSLTAAAKLAGLTQPAASHQVKEAERRLGLKLVQRQGRNLKLTSAGQTLAETAAQCMPLLMEAETKARERSFGNIPRLRIAFGGQNGLSWVADVARFLVSRESPSRLDLIDAGREPPSHILKLGQADFAVEIGGADARNIKRLHIGDDELVCALAPVHPLASATEISADDIVDETYFAHSLISQPGFELEAFFQPARRRPNHVAHIQSLGAIVTLVAAGLGVSIQPHSAIRDSLREGKLVARPLAPTQLSQPWYLQTHPATASNSTGELLQPLARIMAPHFAYAVI